MYLVRHIEHKQNKNKYKLKINLIFSNFPIDQRKFKVNMTFEEVTYFHDGIDNIDLFIHV